MRSPLCKLTVCQCCGVKGSVQLCPKKFSNLELNFDKNEWIICPQREKLDGLVCKTLHGESEVIALSLTCCVTLGKSINFSVPQVLHLYNEDHDTYLKKKVKRLMRQCPKKHIKLHGREMLYNCQPLLLNLKDSKWNHYFIFTCRSYFN